MKSDRQFAEAWPGPIDAGACGGIALAPRIRASAEGFEVVHAPMPAIGDLGPSGRGALAGPPCLTGDDMRAAALVASATGLMPAGSVLPVLAFNAPSVPEAAPDYTGSVNPIAPLPAAPGERPRRGDVRADWMSLAALDGRTAVYDIAAHTVYLPDGTRLEAHSGLGAKRDDPRYVHVRMHGATPPNVYDLALRERLFHGVRAIRLNPAGGSKMFGRDGMLAHTYMLGPNGQSNGCVSFRNYPAFLQAFLKGEIKRMVVVARLPAPPSRAMLRGGARGDQVALNRE